MRSETRHSQSSSNGGCKILFVRFVGSSIRATQERCSWFFISPTKLHHKNYMLIYIAYGPGSRSIRKSSISLNKDWMFLFSVKQIKKKKKIMYFVFS